MPIAVFGSIPHSGGADSNTLLCRCHVNVVAPRRLEPRSFLLAISQSLEICLLLLDGPEAVGRFVAWIAWALGHAQLVASIEEWLQC